MKLTPQCIPCLISKSLSQFQKANVNEEKTMKGMIEVSKLILEKINDSQVLKEYGVNAISPAAIGSLRNNFLLNYIGKDPYKEEKTFATEITMNAIEKTKLIELTNSTLEIENIIYWLRIIAIANSLEFDLEDPGNNPVEKLSLNLINAKNNPLNNEFEEKAFSIAKIIKKSKKLVILTDNTGEHIIDMLFGEFLANNGLNVIIAGKSSPTQNDATIKELEQTKKMLSLKVEITSTTSNTVGLFMTKITKDFRGILEQSDLVIAKGMGHFESFNSVSNLPFRGIIVYKAKCIPVARASGIEKGEYNILPINLI